MVIGIYNLFNNSGRVCGIIEMWEAGRREDEVGGGFGKFSFRMRDNIGYGTFYFKRYL